MPKTALGTELFLERVRRGEEENDSFGLSFVKR